MAILIFFFRYRLMARILREENKIKNGKHLKNVLIEQIIEKNKLVQNIIKKNNNPLQNSDIDEFREIILDSKNVNSRKLQKIYFEELITPKLKNFLSTMYTVNESVELHNNINPELKELPQQQLKVTSTKKWRNQLLKGIPGPDPNKLQNNLILSNKIRYLSECEFSNI